MGAVLRCWGTRETGCPDFFLEDEMAKQKNRTAEAEAPEEAVEAAVADAMEEEPTVDVKPPEAAKAAAEAPKASGGGPVVKHYLVERQSVYYHDGTVNTLHAGSVISTLTHDIGDVQRQGAPLIECEAPSAGKDAYGRPKAADYAEPR